LKSIGKFDICVPIALDAGRSRSDHSFVALARLKPGVTLQQAQAEMNTIARRLEQQYPASNTGWGIVLTPISFILGGIIEPVLIILLGAVGLLLLIACANMASLLLARAASRRRDIAVCTALGASRWCTVRQLLTESLVLSLAGGIVGLMLAGWTVGAMRGIVPDIIPRLQQMDIDPRVLSFTFLVSMLTGILFGLAPALRASKVDLVEELKEGGRNSGGPASQRARTALLVSEVALALVLSISAGLLVRSFIRLMAVDPGFKPENLLTLNLKLPDAKYGDETKRVEFIRTLEEKIAALPGVKSAGAINVLPMRGILLNTRSYVWSYEVEGRPAAHQGEEPNADIRMVTPDFFQTMSIPLRKGRVFTRQDMKSSTAVIIINEALARLQFRNVDPVGKRLRFAPFDLAPREIVGVVSDIKLNGLSSETVPAIFAPYAQLPRTTLGLVVRTSMDPSSLASAIRAAIQQIDPDQPVFNVKTMDKVVSDSVMPYWFSMSLLGVFALLALVLAGVGIYGLTSYTVSQRTHEIGLRMALGAVRGDVLRMVVGRGLLIALIGVGIGLPLSFLMTRAMSGILFGVTATDPMIFAVVPLLLVAVAVLASYLPARRATKVDPMVALRCE
jgi:putative ABC transport system permease protein